MKFRCDLDEEVVECLTFPTDAARVIRAMKDSDIEKFADNR